ncbi:MAG: hypothetical protein WCJ56_13035, partial [bacterium]
MRSWTIFAIFGAILLVMAVFAFFSNKSVQEHPVTKTINQFMKAVKDEDAVTIEKLVDPELITVVKTANGRLTSFNCKGGAIIPGAAFSRTDKKDWTNKELSTLKLNNDFSVSGPTIDDKSQPPLASAGFENN